MSTYDHVNSDLITQFWAQYDENNWVKIRQYSTFGEELVGFFRVEPKELKNDVDKGASCTDVVSYFPVIDVLHIVEQINGSFITQSEKVYKEPNRNDFIKRDYSSVLSFL